MRLLVFFDLPTVTNKDLAEYRKFRKFLLKNGFIMMQESVYSRLVLNNNSSKLLKNQLLKNIPPAGLVELLEVTYQTICKLLSFKILEEEKLVDKIATWVDVNIKLKNTKIFVFVNLQSVLDADKMATLLKQLKYWQVGVLNIASSDYVGSEIFEKIIIDKDLCVI